MQEFQTSLLWILKSFTICMILFILLVFILQKTTAWGRQFWQITHNYFDPRRSVKPIILFAITVFLALISVRVNLVISNWNNTLYNSLQKLDADLFWLQILIFCVIATIHVVNVLVNYWVSNALIIDWRKWLNYKFLNAWLDKQAFYKIQYSDDKLDNPDQRIAQDVVNFAETSLSFAVGIISQLLTTVSFTMLLWNLSGSLFVAGYEIPRGMVFVVFAYVLISSLFAFRLGRALVKLNFENERLNANYRYLLIRIQEYGESVAFYFGEKYEKVILFAKFDNVLANVWKIVYRTLKFTGFNLVISQISVIFPFLIQAGRFFQQKITLGDLMQTINVFSSLHSSLSYFRNSYDDFAKYRAVLNRLSGFEDSIKRAHTLELPLIKDSSNLLIKNLNVRSPNGDLLINNLDLQLYSGDRLLISGKSGTGKTTLLRSLAGLWSYCDGDISLPKDSLFLSQRPYMPQGRLIDLLYYPQSANCENDEKLTVLLEQLNLSHLVSKLYKQENFTQILSLGEMQRLSIARALLLRPKLLFLDEASASLDEELEDFIYQKIVNELTDSIIISVAHRSRLKVYHNKFLNLTSPDKDK